MTKSSLKEISVQDVKGKLGILLPGMGAVSTTFIAGVIAIRKGLSKPFGSLTQMNHIRLGRRDANRNPLIKELIPLVELDNLYFGSWDIFEDNAYDSALNAGVLEKELLDQVKDELSAIKPMKAVFNRKYVKKLDGPHVKKAANWYEYFELLRQDIRDFKTKNGLDRLVMVWTGSTEIFLTRSAIHQTKAAFEKAMRDNDPEIAPSMVYAWAAIAEGIPYANGAPNL